MDSFDEGNSDEFREEFREVPVEEFSDGLCGTCLRPQASSRAHELLRGGEGENLCWGDPTVCRTPDDVLALVAQLREHVVVQDRALRAADDALSRIPLADPDVETLVSAARRRVDEALQGTPAGR